MERLAGRAGAMVGALKALRAERARYRRELDDYRREAAAALRSLPPSVPRVEVERPGPPEELQGILATIRQDLIHHYVCICLHIHV